MTEPVAYYKDYNDGTTLYFRGSSLTETDKRDPLIKPLYTAEQLHPRVKMTQAELDEFNKFFRYRKDTTIGNMLSFIFNRRDNETTNLYKRFYETGTLEGSIKAQTEFAILWANYDPDNQEETIEIVPNMKWFVRSKNRDDEGDYAFLSGIETPDDWGYSKRHDGVNEPGACAYAFDTQDEAELWVTPLTEAVQLPAEGE